MKEKGLRLRKWLVAMTALCLAVGILAVSDGNAVVKAAEGEETEQNTYVLPDVEAEGTYLYDVFMYKILNDGTIEICGYIGDADAVT